jgi:Na+-translocating ferredoxin:NAD+ oxidoreductase RnfD subunit
MDWFLALLAFTTVVRGMGAGIISDVAVVSLPVRHHIGAVPYAQYARALFGGRGAKTYAPVSIGGALLTVAVAVGAFAWTDSSGVRWSVCTALAATVLAFIGTSKALPAMVRLRRISDEEAALAPVLDRFARWHTLSAIWQVVSFVALVVALAYYPAR